MKKIYLIITILLLLSSCGNKNGEITENVNENLVERNVEGTSMEPLIGEGDTVMFSSGYYDDAENTAEIGDIVLYDFKGEQHPIIKSIVARDSDKVELKSNTLYVNDIEVTNSAGDSYNFSQAEQRVLKMYIKENAIPRNSVFILGDNTEVSRDSRKFGAVSLDDMFGKIIE